MLIPEYPLPSNIEKIIQFRSPTVSDCMAFAELDPAYEEQLTTQYLNRIQESELSDSGLWTGEDRRTALWWIFISSREDKTLAFSYQCSECGEVHYPVIDMTTLGETAVTMTGAPYRDIELLKSGEKIAVRVHPLNGYSLEHLERLRNQRDQFEVDSIPYRRASNALSLNELLHSIDIAGQPDDHNDALEFKKTLIESLDVETEFKPFSIDVELALRQMRHGLLSKYHDGGYLLLAQRKANCDKEAQDRTYPILLPFRNIAFVPSL